MKLSDLDRVIEAVERIQRVTPSDSTPSGTWTGSTTARDIADALTLLRTMRDNAVEGHAIVNDETGEAFAWMAAELTDAPKAVLLVIPEDV